RAGGRDRAQRSVRVAGAGVRPRAALRSRAAQPQRRRHRARASHGLQRQPHRGHAPGRARAREGALWHRDLVRERRPGDGAPGGARVVRRRGGERIRPGSRRKPRAAATRSTAGTAQRTRGTAPRTGAAPPRAKLEAPVAVPLLPLRHPALLLVALLAAAGIVASVSFRILDTDFWQHLLVGKAIWRLHRVPQQHLWTWANYGMPEVLPSWGFRALIWPVYRAFGIPGLFAWRWATTLLAFGLMWATARRMGARGLTPLVILVWCSLVYRHRSQIRPETLAAVLLAIEIWVLELRRPAP